MGEGLIGDNSKRDALVPDLPSLQSTAYPHCRLDSFFSDGGPILQQRILFRLPRLQDEEP